MRYIVGLSGGKDSTVLALELMEREPDKNWEYICTPTGDELPPMVEHWLKLEEVLEKPLIRITFKERTLFDVIDLNGMIPNFRSRFCTRQLKIEPTIAWCVENHPVLMHVGLRADEDEREGIYGDLVSSRFPYREWGYGIDDVLRRLAHYENRYGIKVPDRTDCGNCYHQRIREWWNYWNQYPTRFWTMANKETTMGHSLRSPGRDTWPVFLKDLAAEFQRLWDKGGHTFFKARQIREAEKGRILRKGEGEAVGSICRVCTL
jgi:hypothetical protein